MSLLSLFDSLFWCGFISWCGVVGCVIALVPPPMEQTFNDKYKYFLVLERKVESSIF